LFDRLTMMFNLFNHKKKRLHTILSELKELLVQDHAAMNELQAVRTQESQLKVQVEALDEQISALTTKAQMSGEEKKIACASHEQARTVLEQKKAACAAYEKQQEAFLAEGEKVQSLTAALADIEKKRRESLYDAKRHQELEHALAQASADDAARAAALEQRNQLERERSALHERWKMLVQERSAIASEATTIEQSALDASIEDELTAAVVQEKERCSDLRKKKDDLTQEQGQLSAALARIESRRVAIKERQKEVAELSQKQHDCSVLAGAWGKNGIQALLIEQAIPEIEQEANELLGRLSNNQTQIFIESLRDLKRGGARETLDIKISDTSGVRPYEMFSGGEAFRIDFALRIAISKLLCRRAGASLQVLIIDEGFGSQDEEGLARLMQALYAVDDEFAKIIVVSHLPYFKDNFPVHFLVEKGPAGSTVSVDERG
jgi:exonuclease SbcC